MMRKVIFSFAPGTSSQRQQDIFRNVGNWTMVKDIGYLRPNAKNPAIARMAYVYVDQTYTLGAFLVALQYVYDIDPQSIPTTKRVTKYEYASIL